MFSRLHRFGTALAVRLWPANSLSCNNRSNGGFVTRAVAVGNYKEISFINDSLNPKIFQVLFGVICRITVWDIFRMWQIQWLRRLIRRNTKPIPFERAKTWKVRLSVLYAILAWHAFGGVIYMCVTGKQDWMRAGGYVSDKEIPPARSFAHLLGIPKAKVIQVSGLTVQGRYDIDIDEFGMDDTTVEKEEVVAALD